MTKYRIVEVFTDSSQHSSYVEGITYRKPYFAIEQKKWWGWKEVESVEGPTTTSRYFMTYEQAEDYLLGKYTGHGECRKYGNVYTYEPYVYYH